MAQTDRDLIRLVNSRNYQVWSPSVVDDINRPSCRGGIPIPGIHGADLFIHNETEPPKPHEVWLGIVAWTQTGSNLTTKVNYDQFANAVGSSNLTANGVSVSLSMSASRTDNSNLSAYYKQTVSNSGDVTVWGHNSTSTVEWTTSANLTSGSGFLANSEFFNSNLSESLTTNSTWSQTNNGPIVGENNATYSRISDYSGGSSNDYGGSYAYSGGQNWTWSDPKHSTYNARALSEFRITPAGPPDVFPVTFRSAPNFPFNTSDLMGTGTILMVGSDRTGRRTEKPRRPVDHA